jgi:isoquinoline 1-oxidoreductase alpha subunit
MGSNRFGRRGFVKTAGLATGVAAALEVRLGAAAEKGSVKRLGPGPVKLTLRVNGEPRTIEVEPRTTLAEALRDGFSLTGTKVGCDRGACGACTVHLDGVPTRSCATPVSAVGRAKVTTIEGLDPKGAHPLQQAWVELDVPQCGYCQTGQIMTAAELLRDHPAPSDADIDAAMAGHLCRCGAYTRVRAGIHRAAELVASRKGGKRGGK